MLKSAEFPPIDLESTGLVHPNGNQPELITWGLNSRVWLLGRQVIKTSLTYMGHDKADEQRATMQYEHAVMEDFIGEHMPDTTYATVDRADGRGAHTVTVQPFVEGIRLLDCWQSMDDLRSLHRFFERCLKIYDKTGLMPDLSNIRVGFNVGRSRNVIVGDDGEPMLVDTTFGRIQRSERFGPWWTRHIYAGTLAAKQRLERKF